MKFFSAHKTDVGQVAPHNEDYIWVNEASGVFIVADGMGGHEAGDVASELAATSVGKTLVMALPDTPAEPQAMQALLSRAIEKANEVVWQASTQAAQVRRMGATIVVAVLRASVAYIAHAGDARIYLATEDTLTQLTDDDSWVAQLVAGGIISEDERKNNRLSHIITKAVGQGSPVEAAVSGISLSLGNWLLLCSDGLWNMVDDARILAEIQRRPSPAQLVETLVRAANDAGGKDNISLIAIHIA